MPDDRSSNPMGGSDQSRIREVFERVLTLDEHERSRVLSELRSTDADAADEVESLLKFHSRGSSVLDTPLSEAASRVELHATELAPARIGPFEIIREIGRGGMGIVYEGRQDFPRRRAAIKVVRAELVTGSMLRRFLHEAEALAKLRHPAIAQLYEAGFADERARTGPFIAMELVEGQPLSQYARDRQPSTRDALSLMATIADAVDHAHKRGVIHRDLKPGNVLIDAQGQPKVLDFGIARLAEQDQQGATVSTSVGQIIGTLGYMAPEQFEGDPHLIDARCDVYALGVMLYELLTGVAPIDVSTLSLAAASVAVREREPRRVGLIRSELRGDIEAIVAKSLEKKPEERYQSAAELAADIRRFLNDDPVLAHPQTAWYQARKFARRNRVLVMLGAGGVAALLLGVVGTTWQAVRATRARQRADVQSVISEQRAEFLTEVIRAATPQVAGGRETTVRELLDTASKRLLEAPRMDPRVAADTHQLLAEAYYSLGDGVKSEPHARSALDLHTRLLGESSEQAIKDARLLGAALSRRDRNAEALDILRTSLERARSSLGDEHYETIAIWQITAAVLAASKDTADEARRMYMEAIETSDRVFGPDDQRRLAPRLGLAFALFALKDYAEAERISEHVVRERGRLLGEDHADTLVAMHLYLSTLSSQRKWQQFDAIAPDAWERMNRVLGSGHPVTLALTHTRADRLISLGRNEEALPFTKTTLENYERRFGPDAMNTVIARHGYVSCLLSLGMLDEARPQLEVQRGIVEQKYKPDSYMAALVVAQHVQLARLEGDEVKAREWASKVRGTKFESVLEGIATDHSDDRAPR